MMGCMPLDFDRYRAELVTQAELLRGHVEGADPARRVPSCPDWTLGQLLRHVGAGVEWAAEIVRTRATGPLPDDALRLLDGYQSHAPEPLAAEVVAGARALAEALGESGPDADMWTAVPGETPRFWARRFTHELLVHRADAALAADVEYTAAADVARDALDEWMELHTLPMMFDFQPRLRDLLGPDRTLHFHATDVGDAEWVVDLTGEVITWRRAHEKSTVAARGPLTDLLLVVYGRRSVDVLDVVGDRALLDFWLDRVSFG